MQEFTDRVGAAVLGTAGRVASRVQERRDLPVDLLESDDAYLAVFDAPDARGSDVSARYEDGTIIVSVDRFREHRDTYELRVPGRGLRLDGRVSLPPGARVDPTGASAVLREDGTLHVRLPKSDRRE